MTITELSIKRPPLIIVIFTFLMVLGLFSYSGLNYEMIPDITSPIISIVSVYPGASPKEVESSITKIIEESVSNIEKIKRVSSVSLESISLTYVEFTQKAEAATALQEVQRRVNEVLSRLPEESEAPVISKFSMNEMPVLRMAATSEMEEKSFYRYMKETIKPRLARIDGVGAVTLFGGEEREIKINVDKDKLRSRKLSILEIAGAVKRSNLDFPAGKVKDTEGQYTVRLSGKLQSVEAIGNLVIRDVPGYGKIKLRDVAEVIDGKKEIEAISRLNKKTAIGIFIQNQTDANVVEVCGNVREELVKIEKELADKKVHFNIAQDASVFTMQSANAVKFDLMFAIFLVGIVMLLFLHSLRNSLIVMVAIPCSLISTFIAIYLFNYTLNLMTLLALSLVIGILVDDSIVVLENIYRHLEMGKEQRKAAIDGRNEIGFTALSITLIDVVVFLPLALIQGMIGNIVRQFAVVIVVSTLISLFVSFTITPMLASRYSHTGELNKNSLMGKFAFWFEKLFEKFAGLYSETLAWSLKHKALVISSATALLFLSISLLPFGFIGSEFLSPIDRGELSLVMEMEPGAKLEETNAAARKMEDLLLARPDVKTVFANVGSSEDGFMNTYSNNITEMIITLVPKNERKQTINEVSTEIKAMAQQIPGVKPRVAPIMLWGTTDMAPVAIGVNGPNSDEVLSSAIMIEKELKKIDGTSDVRISLVEGKPEIQIQINREKMASLGLTLDVVGAELRTALTGDNSSKFRDGNSEYDIRIMYDNFDKDNPEEVQNISFTNSGGEKIYLKQFAEINYSSGPAKLERRYQNSSILVTSRAVGKAPGDIGEEIKKKINGVSFPSEIQITYEGDLENQDDAFSSLGLAFMAAILFVYLVLAGLYNSFIYPLSVLLTIPLAIIGALLGLALTMNTLNIFTILGMIVLIGLVGKNAILLVDRANQNREKGMEINEALFEAARTRLRPILMTTATLVFGVLPIAVSSGAGNEMKNGLAIVIIGGLTSSLFLTLLLVPVMYVKIEQLKNFLLRVKSKILKLFGSSITVTMPHRAERNMNSFVIFFAAAILLSTSGLIAQERRLSMNEAAAIALENNSDVKVALLGQQQTGQKVREAYGYLLPEISAEGTYIRNTKLPVFYLPGSFLGMPEAGNIAVEIGEKNVYEGYLKFQMPIFNGAIYPGIKAAKTEEKMNTENIRNVKIKTVTDVKKAYLNILFLDRQLSLAEQSYERAKQRQGEVKRLFIQGLSADVDTLTAYIGVENIAPQIFKLKNAIANASEALKYLMGTDLKEKIILTDSLFIPEEEYDEDINGVIRKALTGRPEVKMLEYGIEAAGELKNIQSAGHLPVLSAFGRLKIEAQSGDYKFSQYDWPTSSLVGLQLSVPLFSGFRVDAKVEQAEIEKLKAGEQLKNFREYLNVEIKTALSNMLEAKKNIDARSKTVTLAERNYSIMQSRFKNGLARLSDMQDAELMLKEARNNYTNEVYGYLIVKIDFEKASGLVSVQ